MATILHDDFRAPDVAPKNLKRFLPIFLQFLLEPFSMLLTVQSLLSRPWTTRYGTIQVRPLELVHYVDQAVHLDIARHVCLVY